MTRRKIPKVRTPLPLQYIIPFLNSFITGCFNTDMSQPINRELTIDPNLTYLLYAPPVNLSRRMEFHGGVRRTEQLLVIPKYLST